ncbi:SIS domain-containing protein [Conexibacter sp. JD483]|uniref:SIS domain-containing protein n=1 Tax=unclassified Conexibacter TaxID=2627773 RepID=UPI0027193272|nr:MULTISPECIES: SIS domain-containing protein [unclassified Conexibacter]MDO8188409.1 SIS domain-containing protein [Conexibacter sp. CPCC 205706]MDO8198196.1 SIS domain-containing protein [Conexibacter sp. CPCC 205762]MDR9370668.1 SIS domain-containing protein [Conexibacter sp. JD483]
MSGSASRTGGGAPGAPRAGAGATPGLLGVAMAVEIEQTPAVVDGALAAAGEWTRALRAALPSPLRGVALTARGSSDHAAAYGRVLLESALGVPAWSTAPSIATRYGLTTRLDGVLAIAVSQSGATPEIVSALERQRVGGAVTLAITNDPTSPLARAADVVAPLGAGVETAVPATKTFTATLLAFALAAEALDLTRDASGARGASLIDDPPRVPLDPAAVSAAVRACVADGDAVLPLARAVASADVALHLGRGPLLPIAREAALKLIETTGTAQLAWSTVDVRHGPLALAQPDRPVVLQHVRGPVSEDAREVAALLAARGVPVHVIGDPLDAPGDDVPGATAPAAIAPGAAASGLHVSVPGELPEHLRPLVHAVRLQQLSLAVARERGVDPDHPPGLSKVTATA